MKMNRLILMVATMAMMTTSLYGSFGTLREGKRMEVPHSDLSFAAEKKLEMEYAKEEPQTSEVADAAQVEEQEHNFTTLYFIYPNVIQYINAVSASGSIVELTDGSQWIVRPCDTSIVKKWKPEFGKKTIRASLVQNTDWHWFSHKRHHFLLVNDDNNEAVHVDLELGPFEDQVRTVIQTIDPYNRVIQLSDGTFWNMSSHDDYIYYDLVPGDLKQRRWLPGDVVLVGGNNDWKEWFAFYKRPFILINLSVGGKYGRAGLMNSY